MVKHVIIWNFKDELTEDEKSTAAQKIKKDLEGLMGEIEGMTDIKVYINPLPSSNGDLMLDSTFKDENALKEYLNANIDGMCELCKDRLNKNPLRILDCKVDKDNEILKNAPKTLDFLNEESKESEAKMPMYIVKNKSNGFGKVLSYIVQTILLSLSVL